MREYNKEEVMGNEFFWYEESGIRYSFSADLTNSDYQAYLANVANGNKVPSNSSIPQAGE